MSLRCVYVCARGAGGVCNLSGSSLLLQSYDITTNRKLEALSSFGPLVCCVFSRLTLVRSSNVFLGTRTGFQGSESTAYKGLCIQVYWEGTWGKVVVGGLRLDLVWIGVSGQLGKNEPPCLYWLRVQDYSMDKWQLYVPENSRQSEKPILIFAEGVMSFLDSVSFHIYVLQGASLPELRLG